MNAVYLKRQTRQQQRRHQTKIVQPFEKSLHKLKHPDNAAKANAKHSVDFRKYFFITITF